MCIFDFLIVLFFFFFKQKTAYEMRISDWSSDVCSSDLLGTMAYVDFWKTSEPAPGGTGGQLMVNDPVTGCVSPRPAGSWSATTNLPAGSDGVAWAGMHGGAANQPRDDFQNTLIAPMPAGTYTFTFSAGYLVQSPYTQQGYFRFYGVMPGEPDFKTAHPLRSEEHTSEIQSLMRISYAVSCLKQKRKRS